MKTFTLVTSLTLISFAFGAEIPMKAGLWEVTTKMKTGGSDFDPQAEVKKAMEKMPLEQRKQMEAMMAKSGVSASGNGIKICYTNELLSQAKGFAHDPKRKCDTTIKEQTAKKIVLDFKCEDGSTGTGEWNYSAKKYDGKMKLTKDGKDMDMTFDGRFISADCGDVRPLMAPKK